MDEHVHRRSKRKVKLARERTYAARVAVANQFPRIVFEPGSAPLPFVKAVVTALKRIRFDHEAIVPGLPTLIFRDAKEHGFPAVLSVVWRAAERDHGLGEAVVRRLALSLGEALYGELPSTLIDRYTPYHCVDLEYGRPRRDEIRASFRSLMTAKMDGGTAYHSRRKPTLAVDGRERIVGFSGHAIERICDRTVGEWRTYAGSGDAFAFLDNCVHFEWCDRLSGFTFYNDCSPGYFSWTYAREVAGDLDPRRRHYYRVGYCPAVVAGDLIKAKTLLTPGMRGTPEHEALMRSSLPGASKREMMERTLGLSFRELSSSLDFSPFPGHDMVRAALAADVSSHPGRLGVAP